MITLEVLEKYLKSHKLKPQTVSMYTYVFKSLSEYSEDWPVSSVIIDEWLTGLDGMSDVSIKTYYVVANTVGKYMKRAYKLDNPCEDANVPKVQKKKRRYFTADEMVSIIKACINDNEKLLVAVLIDSGCRIGELATLRASGVGDGWIDVVGKTGERRHRLSPELCERMRVAGADGGTVFKMVDGSDCTVAALKLRMRRVVQRAGIKGKKIGVHTFRHSVGSLVAKHTNSALAVKAVLAHDDIDTSMIYIHDAEESIAQGISPLSLLGQEIASARESGRALPMLTDGSEVVEGEFVEVDGNGHDDMLEELIPEVADGISVRPLLKTEDLRLMRRVFIMYIRGGDVGNDDVRLRELMRRFLRKK